MRNMTVLVATLLVLFDSVAFAESAPAVVEPPPSAQSAVQPTDGQEGPSSAPASDGAATSTDSLAASPAELGVGLTPTMIARLWCDTLCDDVPDALLAIPQGVLTKLGSDDYQDRLDGDAALTPFFYLWFEFNFKNTSLQSRWCAYNKLATAIDADFTRYGLDVLERIRLRLAPLYRQMTRMISGTTMLAFDYIGAQNGDDAVWLSTSEQTFCAPASYTKICSITMDAALAGCAIDQWQCLELDWTPSAVRGAAFLRARSANCLRPTPDIGSGGNVRCPVGYSRIAAPSFRFGYLCKRNTR